VNTAKSFDISKHVVLEAYKRVKANKGASGVDDESIADFEVNLKANLYKIWNRMSSGSYFPPAVRMVEIPKKDGSKRRLGIPTVADRIAQMVAKLYLEPGLEPHFHPDSFGYRPNKSALDAVDSCRKRCWKYNWVVDLDIKGFFDNLDHDLLMRAVRKHTDCKWLHLYIERWLTAPIELPDGQAQKRTKGTPQGGVISPLLANLFLHYAFDKRMERNYPLNPFERYADDVIVHCKTFAEAKSLKAGIEMRLAECKLEAHPDKTKIVYCKDDSRRNSCPVQQFDFLGFTFRPRLVKSKAGEYFVSFGPAISKKAANAIRQTMRTWKLHIKCNRTINEISRLVNPAIRGWINYYGRFRRSALQPIFSLLNLRLMKWAKWKYKKLKGRGRKARHWLGRVAKLNPRLFAHWEFGTRPV
jgi:RNA-directed DNA polymerase